MNLAVIWALLLSLASLITPGGTTARADTLTFVHTNDILGEIEPCGCRSNPLGGFAREYGMLQKQTDRDHRITMDAGDLLFPTVPVPALLGDQSRLQAKYVLKAMELLGYELAVPGEKDYGMGFKEFENLRKGTKIKFIAANLVRGSGAKYLESSAIIPRGRGKDAVKVGVFGIVGEDLSWPGELKATPALEAAKNEVRALREKGATVVIALTHQGYDKDVELGAKVEGIDLIIGGHTQSFLQKPIKSGSAWIFQSSFRNQYVGLIPWPFNPDAYELVGLDAGYESPAGKPSPMDRLVAEFKSSIARLNAPKEQSPADRPTNTAFQTFPRCTECHAKQFNFWAATRHADALEPLIEKKQEMNKECLLCHTVGLGHAHGFMDVSRLGEIHEAGGKPKYLTAQELSPFLKAVHGGKGIGRLVRSWAPVQCENCHGPAGDHPFSGEYPKKVEKTLCLGCHTAERAPAWYLKTGKPDLELIKKKMKSVTCPAGGN